MHAKAVLVRERGKHLDFIRRVDRTVFRRLRDRHSARLHGVVVSESRQVPGNPVTVDLPVRRRYAEKLASNVLLGGAALGGVDVRGVGAYDSVERKRDRLKTENVRARSAEHEEDLCVLAEVLSQLPDS